MLSAPAAEDGATAPAGRLTPTLPEAALPWHGRLRGSLDTDQAGKWRRTLSPSQVRAADAICQPLGARFGYAPTGPATLSLRAIPGRLAGDFVTALERLLFRLPLRPRVAVIRGYRRATGNVIR